MNRNLSFGLLTLLIATSGCGPSEEEQRQAELEAAQEQMEQAANAGDAAGAMEAFGQAMEQMAEGAGGEGAAEPVDFRRLKALMPEEAAGLRRTSHTGERTGAMGMNFSQAEATYEGDDGARVEAKIMDLGGVPQFAMLGFAWTMAEVDRETDTGYERTLTHRGHRGYEEYDTGSRSGRVQLIVADRFAVEANGSGVDADRIMAVVDAMDLGRLAGMRDEGR